MTLAKIFVLSVMQSHSLKGLRVKAFLKINLKELRDHVSNFDLEAIGMTYVPLIPLKESENHERGNLKESSTFLIFWISQNILIFLINIIISFE